MEITFGEYFPYDRHAAVRPALDAAGCDTVRHPVAIVGGGPTGLALALGLANYGVRAVLIEEDATVCTGSRAGAFTRRTLEIFERLGVVKEILPEGHGWNEGWTYYRDRQIAHLRLPADDNQKYPATISQLQNYIEQCMARAAAARAIEIRWQTRFRGIAQDARGVTLDLATPAGDYTLRADRVVATDGGRSAVRQAMNLAMTGERHEGRYLIIDIRIDTTGVPVGRRCWFDPPSKPGGTLLMYRKPNGMLRLDYQLATDEDEDAATRPETVFAQVDAHLKMIGLARPWQPVWMSLYRASAMTLERYRHGRVLFAGDAAHLVPIFGVRGYNSAIDDVHNLAWKLAFVTHGRAPERLLDTYSDERVYAARENHRFASRGADFMSPRTRASRVLRDAVLQLAERQPRLARLVNPKQHAAIPLVASPLNAFPERSAEFSAGPAPGDILPECPLALPGRPAYLTDRLGAHFTAFLFTSDAAPASIAAAIERLAARWPIRLATITPADDPGGRCRALYGATDGTLYLVRPDGHVMARWRDVRDHPDELAAALERALT